MQNNKTQQFARFFIKDLKIKSPKQDSGKFKLDELNISTAN